MLTLTRAQREALKRVYDRRPIYPDAAKNLSDEAKKRYVNPITYRQFRKTVMPLLGDPRCVMVKWGTMWLGIELDGHTHS